MFLVYVALVAMVMPVRLVWGLMVLVIVCFGSLFGLPQHFASSTTHMAGMDAHHEGIWLVLAIVAVAIIYFVMQVTADWEWQRRIMAEAHLRALRDESGDVGCWSCT